MASERVGIDLGSTRARMRASREGIEVRLRRDSAPLPWPTRSFWDGEVRDAEILSQFLDRLLADNGLGMSAQAVIGVHRRADEEGLLRLLAGRIGQAAFYPAGYLAAIGIREYVDDGDDPAVSSVIVDLGRSGSRISFVAGRPPGDHQVVRLPEGGEWSIERLRAAAERRGGVLSASEVEERLALRTAAGRWDLRFLRRSETIERDFSQELEQVLGGWMSAVGGAIFDLVAAADLERIPVYMTGGVSRLVGIGPMLARELDGRGLPAVVSTPRGSLWHQASGAHALACRLEERDWQVLIA